MAGLILLLGLFLSSILIYCSTNASIHGSNEQNEGVSNFMRTLSTIQHNVSNNQGDSVYPQIASYSNYTFIVWQDNFSSNESSNYEILLKRIDNDMVFDDYTINLSNNSGFSEHPQIAAYKNYVYVVWADNTASKNREVLLSISRDSGKTFDRAINLSNNTSDSYNQEISLEGNNVYVVWQDSDDMKGDPLNNSSKVIFRMSPDSGKTFNDPRVLARGNDRTSFPKLAASADGNLYIAWNVATDEDMSRNGIFFTRSSDNGETFSNIAKLSDHFNSGEAQLYSSSDNNNNRLFLVWGGSSATSKENIDDLYLTKSNNEGASFEKARLITESFRNALNPEIIEYNGSVYLASQDSILSEEGDRNEEIFLKSSSDQGTTFDEMINVSNNEGFSECPSLSISGNGDLNIVWQDKTPGNNEVLFTKVKRSVIG